MLKYTCLASLFVLATTFSAATAQDEVSPHSKAMSMVVGAPKPKMIEVTFLGVTATQVSPALNSQLNLPIGLGLVVTHVAPDSPAQQAGLLKHDVLHKLDDQLLANFDQFTTLIRLHEPGDTATLSIIRRGEPMTLTATLKEQKVPDISHHHEGGYNVWLDHNQLAPFEVGQPHMPRIDIDHIQTGAFRPTPHAPFVLSDEHVVRAKDRYKLRIVDGNHKITINKLTDEGPHITVKDADGNILHEGSWDPEADPKDSGLPEGVIKILGEVVTAPRLGKPLLHIKADEIEVTSVPEAPE